MTSTSCSLTTRDFMVVVMRLFDNTVAREPTALQQGDARKDETTPDADASLSLSRQAMSLVECSSRLWRYMPIG